MIDDELRGYSMRDLEKLAGEVMMANYARLGGWVEHEQAKEFAWEGIVVALVTWDKDREPYKTELIEAGWQCLKDEIAHFWQNRGINYTHAGKPSVGFQRYWGSDLGAPFEDAVVDRMAFQQIWVALSPVHRKTLEAHAQADYNTVTGALMLGINKNTYMSRLHVARHAFAKLWHEHERPWVRSSRYRDHYKRPDVSGINLQAGPTRAEQMAAKEAA